MRTLKGTLSTVRHPTTRVGRRPTFARLALRFLPFLSSLAPAPGQALAHAPAIVSAQDSTPAIEQIRLAEDIYLFRAPSDLDWWTSSNSVVIIGEADVTIFDTNTRPSTARLVLDHVRALTDKPVRRLINSHWHMDHWLANEVYAKAFPGVEVIASRQTRDFMARMPLRFFLDEIGLERRRARRDTAVAKGMLPDGTPLTAERRARLDAQVRETQAVHDEISRVTQVLPNVTYEGRYTFWSGSREFRVFSMTGDASGSTVLYLPQDGIVVTGDVLVRREDGTGAQPWTTNSYLITPWLESLRAIDAMDAKVIVPGQGPALYDEDFLHLTIELYESIISQVHTALERGALTLDEVQSQVNLDSVRNRFTHGDPILDAAFERVTSSLIRKVCEEAHDGITPPE